MCGFDIQYHLNVLCPGANSVEVPNSPYLLCFNLMVSFLTMAIVECPFWSSIPMLPVFKTQHLAFFFFKKGR